MRSNLKAGFKDGSDPSKGAGSRRVGRRKEPLIADLVNEVTAGQILIIVINQ